MKILTVENRPYELDTVPDEIDDLRYCALDASDRAVSYTHLTLPTICSV